MFDCAPSRTERSFLAQASFQRAIDRRHEDSLRARRQSISHSFWQFGGSCVGHEDVDYVVRQNSVKYFRSTAR